MTTPDEDIFGQIDALLGKRSPAVLTEKNLQGDDFPMLTEIIKDVSDAQSNMSANHAITSEVNPWQVERRVFERRQNPSSDVPKILLSAINDSVLDALESKLIDLFRSQHASLEKSVRLIFQEELKRYKQD